jgi:hypothetical protein
VNAVHSVPIGSPAGNTHASPFIAHGLVKHPESRLAAVRYTGLQGGSIRPVGGSPFTGPTVLPSGTSMRGLPR